MTTPTHLTAVAALGLVIAAIAGTAGMASSSGGTDLQCGIAKSQQGGMVALEGKFTSPTAVSGEYRLAIKSASNGGSSNISQGGPFSAAAGQEVVLGSVTVNANAHNDITFEVSVSGKKIDCNQELVTRL